MQSASRTNWPILAWVAVTAVWIALAVHYAMGHWPVVPLDLSASDPATRLSYDAVVRDLLWKVGAVALSVPAALLLLLLSFRRAPQPTSPQDEADVTPIVDPSDDAPATPPVKFKGPQRILLMRHAEKTGDPEDIHLSPAGALRAERLAAYIPNTFGTPDYIFAAARSKRSIRSIETLTPLATALATQVRHDIEDSDFADLVDDLFSVKEYRGSIVAIAWHHGKIPDIAKMLGAPKGSYPDPWPEKVFNLILDFEYAGERTPAIVKKITQPF